MVGRILFPLLLLLVCPATGQGQESWEIGRECPEGKVEGDRWTEYSGGTCSRHTCLDENILTEECPGSLNIEIQDECYLESIPGNASLEFDDCCMKYEERCVGDEGFEDKKLWENRLFK